jgi:hypothetical protein
MSDIVKELRQSAEENEYLLPANETMYWAAADEIERLRKALRPDNKLIGDIAHILTGLCNSLCCRKTGGYFEANCECRDVATEIAELYTARAALGEGKE